MSNLPRRSTFAAAVASVAFLSACSQTSPNGVVTLGVNLVGAQKEAQAILLALQSTATSLGSAVPPTATTALNAAEQAVNAFVSLPQGAGYADIAAAVVRTISGVTALIPLAPGVSLAINAGLLLINSLIAGLSSVTVTAPSVSTTPTMGASPGAVAAPIPIPMG